MTADEVRAVACPQCGAAAGERCRDGGKLRRANHAKRVGRAEMLLGWRDGVPGPDRATKTKWREGRHGRR